MTDLHKGYATTPHGQMHYAELGEGPPLVLIGETPRSSRFFDPILLLLAPRVRAIAFDLPGLGNSHPLPEPASVEAMAACVADALDAMGVAKTHLFGMHTGNKVATALAADRPEPLLRDVAEEEAIPSPSHADRIPARHSASMMTFGSKQQRQGGDGDVSKRDDAEININSRMA